MDPFIVSLPTVALVLPSKVGVLPKSKFGPKKHDKRGYCCCKVTLGIAHGLHVLPLGIVPIAPLAVFLFVPVIFFFRTHLRRRGFAITSRNCYGCLGG